MKQSNCCKAIVIVKGDTTKYYVCTKCLKACDIETKQSKEKCIYNHKYGMPCKACGMQEPIYKSQPNSKLNQIEDEIINKFIKRADEFDKGQRVISEAELLIILTNDFIPKSEIKKAFEECHGGGNGKRLLAQLLTK